MEEKMAELSSLAGIGSAYFEIFIMKKIKIKDFFKLFLVYEVLELPDVFLVRVISKTLVILLLFHEL